MPDNDSNDYGNQPKGGWSKLICELLVEDLDISYSFWNEVLGFTCAYQRLEQKFMYLERSEGAQIMLCQRSGKWETGELEMPFGRGILFQIYVDSLQPIESAIDSANYTIHTGPREVWRRTGDIESGSREIVVQDPDGYLIMMAQTLGERPITIVE